MRDGWCLQTAMYSFQNNGNYWEDPEKFVPERYLADEQGAAGMPAWAPFGDVGGPAGSLSDCLLNVSSH